MSIDSLKNQARHHEQREEWAKALELYLKVIDRTDDQDDLEIALLNRVADIQIRLGDIDGAMKNYERAIDYYVEADLANNAIALCRKITRSAPNRASAYLRMGQIRARQGFMVDARQNFLTYAELQQAKGGVEEALRALAEFVALAPEDAETRLFLAELLAGMTRLDEALPHFDAVYLRMESSGDEEGATRIAGRIRELDPDRPLPTAGGAPAPSAGREEDIGFESTALSFDSEDEAEEEEAPTPSDEGEVVGELAFSDLAFEEGGGAPEEVAATDDEQEEDDILTPLPLMELDGDGYPDDDEDDEDGEEAGISDLPLLELGPDEEEPAPLQSAWEEAGADVSFEVEAPDPADELTRLRAQIAHEPDDLAHRQRLVEYAYQVDDRALLIQAFLQLAGTLRRLGESAKSQAVYRQVLNLDSQNAEALEALDALGSSVVAPPASGPRGGEGAPAAGEGFVDLGSLIQDEEKAEATTRWVVSAQAPSGDEQADFSHMLQQFKAKVAEHLSADDANAHYDLGTAYKDMGLFDEAIGEFQQALRAQPGHLPTHEMLGLCFLEKGEPEVAIRSLERAREISFQVEDDLLGIYYYLGRGHEAVGNQDEAREFFEKVFSLDINFRDVTERLRTLR